MDKKESEMSSKRKSESMEILFDSDDNEPIGTLLKLKGNRKSKKVKVVADGGGNKVKGVEKIVVEDEELGGLDDTLANFRKKLRGPKKDGGSAVPEGKDLSSNVVGHLRESLTESAKDRESGPDLMSGVQEKGLGNTEDESSGDDQVSEYRSSPASACGNIKYVVAFQTKHDNESQKLVDESANDLEPSHVLHEGTCPSNYDDPSGNEVVNRTSYSSAMLDRGSCPEEKGSIDDPETKESSLSVVQRAARNAKKRRHGDMAYEGDADWEVLMQGQEFFVSDQVVDKTRKKFNPSAMAVGAEDGKAAAVSVGLKACAVGPIEKIKFKEVLKRKGGLQEYLECRYFSSIYMLAAFVGTVRCSKKHHCPFSSTVLRNHILSVWNRDVSRILPLSDFGVSDGHLMGESPRASLIRDVYIFLDELGYINFGVPSEKKNIENNIKPDLKLLTEKLGENSGLPIADSENEVSIILGKEKSSETCIRGENDDASADEKLTGKFEREGVVNLQAVSSSSPDSHTLCDSGPRKSIIVVGAGPAGLTAARHLQLQGFDVKVLEARSRIGGRVYTDRSSLSVPVDLGASIITGVEADVATERRPDPSSLICAQLRLDLTVLNSDCPLYDTVTNQRVPADLDEALEAEFNSLLDEMILVVDEKGEHAKKMSLEEGLEYALKRRHFSSPGVDDTGHVSVKSVDTSVAAKRFDKDDLVSNAQDSKAEGLSPLERRVMDWHFAHLEYGCAALLKEVSLPNWNQDDVYGGFGGPHCMIKGGYSAVVESLGEGICILLDHIVTDITYCPEDSGTNNDVYSKVKVSTSNDQVFLGDAVLVTVPLGCLKAETINFSPPLPDWKYLSIKRLGFGVLNKVVLEFPEVFWDENVDYFGATAEDADQRGRCFMFWNVKKTVGAPVLIALVVGKAAVDDQNISFPEHVSHALLILRKLFGEDKVSDPVASAVTDWGRDPYSYGAYSYVAVGSSGDDYDILGKPVENCIFFAGEATCKEHPDTVGGAMISGLREAVRIIDILKTGTDHTAEVEAMEAARRRSNIERSEVKDIIRRLDAVEFSSAVYTNSLDGSQISAWGCMLKDMFFNAKTTAGRLHLAKELLNLPVKFLKTFASTREGLSTLNSWILDSMGKDGTQLLRHCVRLLVLVSNDLLAVRLSGVGKTVKEKVCVHTSRDIRAIASQLVNVWVELFRKEKAAKGGLKLLRHPTAPDLKNKSSLGSTGIDPKSDVLLSNTHGSTRCINVMEDIHEIPMSEEEKAAFAAAEAARAAAIAAAKAYAAMHNTSTQLPKILSFQKFSTHEQYTHMDEPDSRKNWSAAAIGRQDFLSEIDSRNCRVRDWSVDFSAAGVNLENSKMSVDNHSQRSHKSNVAASQLNFREHSAENIVVDNSLSTKAWVDSAGSEGLKDYSAIERWQCQAAAASSGISHGTMHVTDEEDSNMSKKFHKQKHDAPVNESSASQVTIHKESKHNHARGAESIKKSVVDYVASLLMPLYKARKIDKDGYKSIMKKTATKVMEKATDAEKGMTVFEFLEYKRKNKIRALVDMLIERHMAMKPDARLGSSEKK